MDLDPDAIQHAQARLKIYAQRIVLIRGSFASLARIASAQAFQAVDGVLFDLGLSSLQLDDAQRGFSFQQEGPLDMRFDPDQELTAAELVNGLSLDELVQTLRRYGEERRARAIARAIVRERPVRTTKQLADLVTKVVPRKGPIHPATRTFQALRIAVNNELEALEEALPQAVQVLRSGGRLAVISFHSLEDRLVKDFLVRESKACICPPETPVCLCHHQPTLRILTRKPIRPSLEEKENNPRSRSARLRFAEKL